MNTELEEEITDVLNATHTHINRFNLVIVKSMNDVGNLEIIRELLECMTDIINDALIKDKLIIKMLDDIKK